MPLEGHGTPRVPCFIYQLLLGPPVSTSHLPTLLWLKVGSVWVAVEYL